MAPNSVQPLNAIGAKTLAVAVQHKDIPGVAEELAKQTLIDTRSAHRSLPHKRKGYTQKAVIWRAQTICEPNMPTGLSERFSSICTKKALPSGAS